MIERVYTPVLLLYKRGDDFRRELDANNNNFSKACIEYAKNLWSASETLKEISEALLSCPLNIHADTHWIEITPRNDIAKNICEELVKKGLLSFQDFEYEETITIPEYAEGESEESEFEDEEY